MIIFLSIIQILLCVSIIALIVFDKPDSSGLSSITSNFNSNSFNGKTKKRLRPISKVILTLVILFFANSIILGKVFNDKARKNKIAYKIEQSNNSNIKDIANKQDATKNNNEVPFN